MTAAFDSLGGSCTKSDEPSSPLRTRSSAPTLVGVSSNWNLCAARPSALFSTAFFMRFIVATRRAQTLANGKESADTSPTKVSKPTR